MLLRAQGQSWSALLQVLLIHGADASIQEQNEMTPEEFICRCLTYKGDLTMTQCAKGKCVGEQDKLVLKRVFAVNRGEP